jgi:hypothetical protein
MMYPLYNLRPSDVETFMSLGAVRCSMQRLLKNHRNEFRRYWHTNEPATLADDDYFTFTDLVYFWNVAGDEIGYANTWNLPPEHKPCIFEKPRVWAEQFTRNQVYFDFELAGPPCPRRLRDARLITAQNEA